MKNCPDCGEKMTLVTPYYQWFCPECLKYPLHPYYYFTGSARNIAGNSMINLAYGISAIMAFILAIFYLVGLFSLDIGVLSAEYENGEGLIDGDLVSRGALNIVISIGLLLSMGLFLKHTLGKKTWWMAHKNGFDEGDTGKAESYAMKKESVSIISIPFWTLIFLGVITIFVGLFTVNMSHTPLSYTVSILNVIAGPVMIFLGYILYSNEIRTFKRNIFPVIG